MKTWTRAFPETTADAVFALACRGVSNCPSYCRCVDTAPFAFEARRAADAPNGDVLNGVVARFAGRAPPTPSSSGRLRWMTPRRTWRTTELRGAAVSCCCALSWVTPQQGAFLERVVDDALTAASAAAPDEADATVAALLARADFENGRHTRRRRGARLAVGEVGGLVLIDRRERKNTSPE